MAIMFLEGSGRCELAARSSDISLDWATSNRDTKDNFDTRDAELTKLGSQ